MIFEHEFIDLANTAGISNVSTRGQPITSTLCKKVNNNNFNLKINFINLSKI